MKLECTCGNLIYDDTDFLNYKASVISDQDYEDLMTELKDAPVDPWESVGRFRAATLYQCHVCSRLLFVRGEKLSVYAAEGDHANVLHSVKEENWQRPLIGHWRKSEGELFWGSTASEDGDNGYLTNIATWTEFESSYREIFERLRSRGRLRSALLTRDGETVHWWSPRSSD